MLNNILDITSVFADVFLAQEVDINMLLGLNDQDLKELGIATFGHRRRLLFAIKSGYFNIFCRGTPHCHIPEFGREALDAVCLMLNEAKGSIYTKLVY